MSFGEIQVNTGKSPRCRANSVSLINVVLRDVICFLEQLDMSIMSNCSDVSNFRATILPPQPNKAPSGYFYSASCLKNHLFIT